MSMDLKDLPTPVSPSMPQSVAPAADYVQLRTARRKRRRTFAWAIFGLVGVAIGAVWAAGLATSETQPGTETAAPNVVGSTNPFPASRFDGLVTTNSNLTIGFSGLWGVVAADTPMFNFDATTLADGTYFATVYLNATPAGWEQIQIKFLIVPKSCTTAVAGDWTTAAGGTANQNYSVVALDVADAKATFNNLAVAGGDDQFCIGVQNIAKANDTAGTFLRRPSASVTPTMPSFIAAANQSA
jgi:hypothetical protein